MNKQAPMTEQELQKRAISRAIGLGLAGEVVRVKQGWYRVPSSSTPGQVYTVRVVDGHWSCDCEAGRSHRPCVHAAAVLIRKIEAGGGRVVGPSVPAPVPANVITFARKAA